MADFDAEQVKTLNQQHGLPITAEELSQLMELLGGQPYLTRQALYTLVTQGLTWSQLTRNAATDYGPFGPHLRRLYSDISDKPKLKKALKQVIDSNRCSDDQSCFRLLRAGLIKRHGERYSCRCDLYRRYFERKLS